MDIRGGVVPERMVSNPRIRFSDEWLVRVDGESPAKRTTFYISVCINKYYTPKIIPSMHVRALFSG